jgi:hypothetical protein
VPSHAPRYSAGRGESQGDPAGVRVPKPRMPLVSESRPGPVSRTENPAFQAPRKPVRAARQKPRSTAAFVRKRAVRALRPPENPAATDRRQRGRAVSARSRSGAADSSAGLGLSSFRSAKPNVVKTCRNPKDSGLFRGRIPELDSAA